MRRKQFPRKNVLRGTILSYNAGIQNRYVKSINKLVSEMTKVTTREIIKLFKGEIAEEFFKKQETLTAMDAKALFDDTMEIPTFENEDKRKYEVKSLSYKAKILLNSLSKKFDLLFKEESPKMVNKMLSATEKQSKNSINASLNKITPENFTLKTGLIKKNEKEVYKALIEENVNLFKLIPNTYFSQVTSAVMTSISTGKGLPDLVPTLEKGYRQNPKLNKYKEEGIEYYNKKIKRKAHLAGLDQTRKAFTSINKQKLVNVGIKQFEWSHSYGGMEPRKSHIKMDGHIFSFENLEKEQAAMGVPPDDRGLPGYPINCRCAMGAVINFDDDSLE